MKFFLVLVVSIFSFGLGYGQVIIHQESFELAPAGVGTNYEAAVEFGTSDVNDYWHRVLVSGNGKDELNAGVSGADGTYMYAGEDFDDRELTLKNISVLGYTNIKVKLSVGSGQQNKYDSDDFIKVFVKKNNGAEELIGAFYGYDHSNGDNSNGRMYHDINLNGTTSDSSSVILSEALSEFSFDVTGVISTLQVIVKMNTNYGDEVLIVDNIIIEGVSASTDTELNFASATYLSSENGTSIVLCVDITNESATATIADIVLTSTSAPHVTYSTTGITFPSSSSVQQCVTVTIADNAVCGDATDYTFEIQNVNGGTNTSAGSTNQSILSISDDDAISGVAAYQGFEGVGTYGFTASPVSYTASGDIWGITTNYGAISGPSAGSNFWAGDDLQNGNGGGTFDHTLTFDNYITSSLDNASISFNYNAQGFNTSGDYLKYTLTWTGSSTPSPGTVTLVQNASTSGWQSELISIPADATSIDLVLIAKSNGSNPCGFDNITIIGNQCLTTSPTITLGSTSMSGFTYEEGSIISTPQTNTVSWTNLVASVSSINTVNYFQFSVDGGTNYNSAAATLNIGIPVPFSATFGTISVLIKLIPGLTTGIYKDTVAFSTSDGAGGLIADTIYLEGEVTAPVVPCSELFISEYVEDGNQKYIEIYNPTTTTVDLTNYDVAIYSNANTFPNPAINMTGSIVSGGVFVIKGSNSTDWSGTADLSTGSLSFNGNDAVALRKSGAIIDIIGPIGNTTYFGDDRTLSRLTTVQLPNDTYDVSEWTETDPYTVVDLGSHVSACVAVCSMDALAANTQTACDPSTNTYTQEVTVTYSTAPTSGTLDVNGQSFAIGTSPQLVTLTGLTADGATVNVVATFSATIACTFTSNALFTAPANCSPVCNVSGITAGTQTACDPSTNTYTQEVTVTYATPPTSGTLDINGQSFAITASPQTETLINLTSDGLSVNVTAVFSEDVACTFTANSLFSAAADCTPETPCSELFISEYVEGSSYNKYLEIYNPTAGTVNLTNYSIVIYSNGSSTVSSTINLSGSIISGDVFVVRHSSASVWSGTTDQTSGALSFSGNDAIALRNNTVDVDVFGVIGSSVTFADNQTFTRNTSVQVPITTYTSSEWSISASNTVADLGSHITACVTVTYDWTGTTDTDWNTASNWSGGIVPTVANTSTIPDVSGLSGNFPLITPFVTLGDITVDASASITVTTGIVLDGVFTNNGTMTLQDGAYLDDFTNSGASFIGNITVETVVANGVANDQRFISSPISLPIFAQIADDLSGPWGTGAQGVNGVAVTVDDCSTPTLAPTSNYGNLFEYDETLVLLPSQCELDGWVVRSSGSLANARGYSAYLTNGSTVDFTGTPNTGAIQINTTNTGSGVIAAEGWNLLGNPYPSPIGRNAVITAGASDVQYFVTSGVYQGSYTAYGIGSNIAIGQGFQVHVNTSGNINFDNTMRNTNAATWYENENWFEYKLEVSVQGNSFADKTTLFYNNEASNNYEPMFDVRKRKSSVGHPTLSTVGANKDLTLNGLSVNDLGETVPMNLDAGANGIFTLSFEGLETFPSNTTIYVKDLQEDVVHNIADGNYTFTANTTDNKERFEIIFIPVVSLVTTKVDCDENAGNVELSNTNFTNDRTFEIISNNTIVATNDLVNLNESLTAGTYTLNVNDQYGGTQVYTVVIEAAELIEAAFTVSNNELFVGEMLILNNTTINTNTIDWTIDNSMITNVNNLTYTFEVAGIYDVVMTVSNDECIAAKTETITVVNKTKGIDSIDGENITFYPNPVTDVLCINSTTEINIEIVDILGKIIVKTSKNTINLENVATGIYIIQMYDVNNKLIATEKLIKQ